MIRILYYATAVYRFFVSFYNNFVYVTFYANVELIAGVKKRYTKEKIDALKNRVLTSLIEKLDIGKHVIEIRDFDQ